MALQVWLPLNGDLTNQGLSNITVTNNGATVDNNGKIGKCYSFSNGNTLFCADTILSKSQNEYSISVWAKGYGCLYSQRPEVNSMYRCIFIYSQNRILFDEGNRWDASVTYDGNNWNHFVFIKNGSKRYIYINGHLAGENTNASTPSQISTGFFIGDSQNTATSTTGNPFIGKMNDFRIYDHALSAKEVKELAKGLVLHYRLAGPGRPNLLSYQKIVKQNNVSFSYDASTLTFTTKTPTTATYYGIRMNTDNCIIPWNHVGIMSMDILSPVATTFYRDDNDYAVSGNSWSGNDNTTRGSIVTAIPANKWTKIIIYSINNSSLNTNHESVKVQSSFNINTANVEFKFKNVKFEVSPISTDRNVTPWCPASDDPLYTALGYNNNIEYDCSGYRRNGTKSGTITWDIDSPRYTTSYKFNTGSDYIKTNFSATMDELSISFWVKPSSSNGGYSIICSNYNNPSGGLWLATNCEGCSVWAYRGAYMSVSGSLANNIWHHCVYTFKNGVSKWYVNGEEKTLTQNTYTGTTMLIMDLTIGNSYTGTSWNTKRYGNLSDFRLYCTALSAEDIAELYHSAVIVDNTGKSYAYEYFEEQ